MFMPKFSSVRWVRIQKHCSYQRSAQETSVSTHSKSILRFKSSLLWNFPAFLFHYFSLSFLIVDLLPHFLFVLGSLLTVFRVSDSVPGTQLRPPACKACGLACSKLKYLSLMCLKKCYVVSAIESHTGKANAIPCATVQTTSQPPLIFLSIFLAMSMGKFVFQGEGWRKWYY